MMALAQYFRVGVSGQRRLHIVFEYSHGHLGDVRVGVAIHECNLRAFLQCRIFLLCVHDELVQADFAIVVDVQLAPSSQFLGAVFHEHRQVVLFHLLGGSVQQFKVLLPCFFADVQA